MTQRSNSRSGHTWSGFIGIDWSGAKSQFLAGLQLAIAAPGDSVPRSIAPPNQQSWSRQDIFDFLVDQAASLPAGARLLVGIDFAFAHPFCDFNSYYPDCDNAPTTASQLWRLVDTVNEDLPHFYGGGMFQHPQWGAYYLAPPDFHAPRYPTRRRVTEQAAKAAGRSPSSTFKAVGADNVCTGSMAGMRFLHQLKQSLGDRLAVWPFDFDWRTSPMVKLVLVEIFPSFYFYRVGLSPVKQAAAEAEFLNKGLDLYKSAGVPCDFAANGPDADEADAIIAAAALRYFAQQAAPQNQTMFDLPPSLSTIARQEGWIFGVDPKFAMPFVS